MCYSREVFHVKQRIGWVVRQPGGPRGVSRGTYRCRVWGRGCWPTRCGLSVVRPGGAAEGRGIGGGCVGGGNAMDVSRETFWRSWCPGPSWRDGPSARGPATCGPHGRGVSRDTRGRCARPCAVSAGGRAPGSAIVSRETVMPVLTGLAGCRRRPSAAPVRAGGPRRLRGRLSGPTPCGTPPRLS